MKRLLTFPISLPKWRKGNIFSRIARIIFERGETRKALGFLLAFLMILSGPLTPVWGLQVMAEDQEKVINPPQKVIATQTTFQKPVEGIISQGFHWYHQAVDIANSEGSQVKPVAAGKIIETGYQFWAYGNFVIVEHGDNITSVYAHLKTVKVVVSQEVTKDTVLGLVGSTGRSTGAHLHLEIRENDKNLNPFSVIEEL